MSTAALAPSFDWCARVTRREAKNFYYALVLLPPARRRAMYAMYAWMRRLDDLADDGAPGAATTARIEEFLRRTRAVLGSADLDALEKETDQNKADALLWPAFRHSVRCFQIPPELFEEAGQGALSDQTHQRFESFAELRRYCYLVASTVGLITVRVFGVRQDKNQRQTPTPSAQKIREWTEDLGVAFQLSNILRDLGEDAARGRIYLPRDLLAAHAVSDADLLARKHAPASLRAAATELAARAEELYERAAPLMACVEAESQPALRAMVVLYRALLRRVVAKKFPLHQRVSVPAPQKLGILARAVLGLGGTT